MATTNLLIIENEAVPAMALHNLPKEEGCVVNRNRASTFSRWEVFLPGLIQLPGRLNKPDFFGYFDIC